MHRGTQALLLVLSFLILASPGSLLGAAKGKTKKAAASLSLQSILRPAKKQKRKQSKSRAPATYTFSGAVDDSISMIRLCQGSDASCSECRDPVLEISSGAAAPYVTTGTTYHVQPAAIAEYFKATGDRSAGTYRVSLYVRSAHRNCSGEYCQASTDGTNPLCVSAVYDGTNVTSLTQVDNGNVTLNGSTALFAYIPSANLGTVSSCAINNNGTLASCATTPAAGAPAWTPNSTTITRTQGAAGGNFGYVTDTSMALVYRCSAASDGTFNSCAATPSTGSSWSSGSGEIPQDVTFLSLPSGRYAYVASQAAVFRCTVDTATGDLDSCTTAIAVSPGWGEASSVSFAPVNGTLYAYVSDRTGGGVPAYRCSLNSDGTFAACASVNNVGLTTKTMAISNFSGTKYAYLAESGTGVWQCPMTAGGALDPCSSTPSAPPVWLPESVTFETIQGVRYAYVPSTSGNGSIYQCTLNADGSFDSCTVAQAALAGGWSPTGIRFGDF